MDKEIWKSVVGYEGLYEVSNIGRVKSLPRIRPHSSGNGSFLKNGKIISTVAGKAFNGYTNVSISPLKSKQISLFLHRVVAEAFIPNPENKPFVNHKNGIKTDNRVENLEWVTRSENAIHSFHIGLQCNKGINHPRSILTEEDVYAIRLAKKAGFTSYGIFKDYFPKLSYTTIKDVVSRKTWSHI